MEIVIGSHGRRWSRFRGRRGKNVRDKSACRIDFLAGFIAGIFTAVMLALIAALLAIAVIVGSATQAPPVQRAEYNVFHEKG